MIIANLIGTGFAASQTSQFDTWMDSSWFFISFFSNSGFGIGYINIRNSDDVFHI